MSDLDKTVWETPAAHSSIELKLGQRSDKPESDNLFFFKYHNLVAFVQEVRV